MAKVDTIKWAIKNVDTGSMVANKWSRTLWDQKPTNAMNSVAWKYSRHTKKEANLECVRVKVIELGDDND